jgi:signal transduction histidine kinase
MRNHLNLNRSIENRILFALVIIGIVPLAISLIFNNFIISSSLLKLEKKNILVLEDRTKNIIDSRINELGMFTRDYSIWDDAYEKIYSRDYEWFKKNYSGWIPGNFNVDLSVVINKDKEVIDEFGMKNDDISQLLEVEGISNILKGLYDRKNDSTNKGMLMYSGEPYLFYASPILKNYYEGEPRGVLIVAKKISPQFIGEIERRLNEKLFISFGNTIVHDFEMHNSIAEYTKTTNSNNSSNNLRFINNELMDSVSLGRIENGPEAYLTIIMNRDIFMETKRALYIGSNSIILLSLIGILIASLFLRKNTTLPIKKFENQIYKMNQNNVISYVESDGPIEVKNLADAFNRMVNKINEQSIENQNLRSELEYDRLRSEFLTNVSHEFKTPLNVILGAVQLIELLLKQDSKNSLSKNIGKHVLVMRQNCYRLLRLINNLIDLTKLQSNAYKIHLGNYNIVSLIEDITLSVAEYTESKGIYVGFDTDTEEKIMSCDPDQIERIILNLLSNSIKFSKPGGEVWVSVHDKEDSVLISIKDTGLGIPEDQLEAIFERFKQVDMSLTRNHEGSGIGLSLVKSLVEMHKGTINVESTYGKGSEFLIELPVTMLSETAAANEKNIFEDQNKVERINIEFSDIYSNC